MKKQEKKIKPIEVDFHDVAEIENHQDVNVNKIVKSKKLPFRLVVAKLQKKAKSILNNKTKAKELTTNALAFVKKLGNISIIKKWVLDVPKLCDMLIDTINGDYKSIPYSSLVIVAIAFVYAITPIDLLPDGIPFAGLIDDALVLKIVVETIKNDLESYDSWKENREVAWKENL